MPSSSQIPTRLRPALGREEFAKFKILAKEEFQSQYVKMRAAQDEKYFEQKKSEELGTILNSYLGSSQQEGFDPVQGEKVLKGAWKTTHDEILGFAGIDGRNIAKNAIHEFMLSGLGDPRRAKQILSSVGAISQLPVGNTIVGKDPEIMAIVGQMRERLQGEVRSQEVQDRADRRWASEDAVDAFIGKKSAELLDSKNKKQEMGAFLFKAKQDIESDASLVGDAKQKAISRLEGLTRDVYNLGELGDVLDNKRKHQDYLQLEQMLRAGQHPTFYGMDLTVVAAQNADLTGEDRARMNQLLVGIKTGI